MSIYIFSRPIHTGKTTVLMQWCKRQKNIKGILMPDINGGRKIFDLDTKEIFDAECVDVANTKEPLISIGKYSFYATAFEKANFILLNALKGSPGWLIIDEAGKLELKGKGFYTSIAQAVKTYDNEDESTNLLITVRDTLCEEVIAFFNIKNFKVIDNLDLLK